MGKEDTNNTILCSTCKGLWTKTLQKELDFRFDYLVEHTEGDENELNQKMRAWKDIISYEGTYMNSSFFKNSEHNTYNKESAGIRSMTIPILNNQSSNLLSIFNVDKSIVKKLKYKTISIIQIPLQHLATQLCYIDSRLMGLIEWSELQTGAWLAKDNAVTAKNVLELIRFFNKVTSIVVKTIVSLKKVTERKIAIEYFIKLSDLLYKSNNFNSLQAINAALNQQSVFRLKQTWKLISPTNLQRYEKQLEFLDMSNNYLSYRTRVKELLANKTMLLPFFGIFLSDVNAVLSYIKFKNEQVDKLPEKSKELPEENWQHVANPYEFISLSKAIDDPVYNYDDEDIYESTNSLLLNETTLKKNSYGNCYDGENDTYLCSNTIHRSISSENSSKSLTRATQLFAKDRNSMNEKVKAVKKVKEKASTQKKNNSKERKFGGIKFIQNPLRGKKNIFENAKSSDNEEETQEVKRIKKELSESDSKMKEIEEAFYIFKIHATYFSADSCQLVPAIIFSTEVANDNEMYNLSCQVEPNV